LPFRFASLLPFGTARLTSFGWSMTSWVILPSSTRSLNTLDSQTFRNGVLERSSGSGMNVPSGVNAP